jgi:hypothetical protein
MTHTNLYCRHLHRFQILITGVSESCAPRHWLVAVGLADLAELCMSNAATTETDACSSYIVHMRLSLLSNSSW